MRPSPSGSPGGLSFPPPPVGWGSRTRAFPPKVPNPTAAGHRDDRGRGGGWPAGDIRRRVGVGASNPGRGLRGAGRGSAAPSRKKGRAGRSGPLGASLTEWWLLGSSGRPRGRRLPRPQPGGLQEPPSHLFKHSGHHRTAARRPAHPRRRHRHRPASQDHAPCSSWPIMKRSPRRVPPLIPAEANQSASAEDATPPTPPPPRNARPPESASPEGVAPPGRRHSTHARWRPRGAWTRHLRTGGPGALVLNACALASPGVGPRHMRGDGPGGSMDSTPAHWRPWEQALDACALAARRSKWGKLPAPSRSSSFSDSHVVLFLSPGREQQPGPRGCYLGGGKAPDPGFWELRGSGHVPPGHRAHRVLERPVSPGSGAASPGLRARVWTRRGWLRVCREPSPD